MNLTVPRELAERANAFLPNLEKFLLKQGIPKRVVDDHLDPKAFGAPSPDAGDADLHRHLLDQLHRRVGTVLSIAELAPLSSKQAIALALVEDGGLEYHAVAKLCLCEVGTIKSRINRGRWILKPDEMQKHKEKISKKKKQ